MPASIPPPPPPPPSTIKLESLILYQYLKYTSLSPNNMNQQKPTTWLPYSDPVDVFGELDDNATGRRGHCSFQQCSHSNRTKITTCKPHKREKPKAMKILLISLVPRHYPSFSMFLHRKVGGGGGDIKTGIVSGGVLYTYLQQVPKIVSEDLDTL